MSWEKQPGHCPSCKAAVPPDSKDCLACGCVFDKWHAKQARESVTGFVEKEGRAQAQARPAYDAAPATESAERGALPKKLAGALAGASAAALLYWLYAPGAPAPAPQAAQEAGKGGFSYVVPEGWTVASKDPGCRDGGCVIVALRLDGPKDRVNPSLTVRLLEKGPESLAGAARAALLEEVRTSLNAGFDAGSAETPRELAVDGLPAVRVEGSGVKHMRLQTQEQVAMNADAYLREQEAKNPNKGFYSVMAKVDYSRPHSNPYVVTQEAQFVEIDARKTDGVVLVPLSRRLLHVSYQFDQSDAATAGAAVDEFLAGLRVSDRSRPVDRLGPLKPPAQIGAIGLIFAAVFLLLT